MGKGIYWCPLGLYLPSSHIFTMDESISNNTSYLYFPIYESNDTLMTNRTSFRDYLDLNNTSLNLTDNFTSPQDICFLDDELRLTWIDGATFAILFVLSSLGLCFNGFILWVLSKASDRTPMDYVQGSYRTVLAMGRIEKDGLSVRLQRVFRCVFASL